MVRAENGMTFNGEYLRVSTGVVWAHFWTYPLVFNVWLVCPDTSVCTEEFLQNFVNEQVAKIQKIPKRLWTPGWVQTKENMNELRKYA